MKEVENDWRYCLIPCVSAFLHKYSLRRGSLALCGRYAVSRRTTSWSLLKPTGGRRLHLTLKLGCDINTISNVLLPCWEVNNLFQA